MRSSPLMQKLGAFHPMRSVIPGCAARMTSRSACTSSFSAVLAQRATRYERDPSGHDQAGDKPESGDGGHGPRRWAPRHPRALWRPRSTRRRGRGWPRSWPPRTRRTHGCACSPSDVRGDRLDRGEHVSPITVATTSIAGITIQGLEKTCEFRRRGYWRWTFFTAKTLMLRTLYVLSATEFRSCRVQRPRGRADRGSRKRNPRGSSHREPLARLS